MAPFILVFVTESIFEITYQRGYGTKKKDSGGHRQGRYRKYSPFAHRELLGSPASRIRAMRCFSEQERFRMVLRLCRLAASTFV